VALLEISDLVAVWDRPTGALSVLAVEPLVHRRWYRVPV
jgi:hypothetical protein